MTLDGKVALVTGASRGIGAAVATKLGSHGAAVVVNYYANEHGADERAQAEEVVQAIQQRGGNAVAAAGDVSDDEQLRGLFDVAEQQLGGLDILVNNAAAWRFSPIANAADDDFDAIFATGARAAFIAMREAANRMRDGGRIVTIGAGVVRMPRPGTGLYGASKAATDHLVRVLATELGPRQITVNSVLPGATNTDALKALDQTALDAEIARTPLGRVGEPGDIASVVAFLASEEGRWVTGQRIGAGGGMF
jgi:3-oxoacyl-[acyl-carrier protein] reductase